MYYSFYGLITGMVGTYLIAKVTDMEMKSSGGWECRTIKFKIIMLLILLHSHYVADI